MISTASDGAIKPAAALVATPDEWLSRFRRGRQATDGAVLDHSFSAVTFVPWRTPRTYDAKKHALDRSVVDRDFDGAGTLCHHHAQLDRDGYVAVDRFTDAGKAAAREKIAAVVFNGPSSDPDQSYAAHDAAKGLTAPYGLADLVAGAERKPPEFPVPAPASSPSSASSQSQVDSATSPVDAGSRG